MDLFSTLKHKTGTINLLIEFTSDDLIDHFEHLKKDPSAEANCKICKRLNMLRRHVPQLKELVDTGKIKDTTTSKSRLRKKDEKQ